MKYEIDIDVGIKKKCHKKRISYPKALIDGKLKLVNPLIGRIYPTKYYRELKSKSI